MSDFIEIYTDGACSGNPGPGGWGAVLMYKDHKKELSGHVENTTNNQMEIRAVIEALKAIKKKKKVIVNTDSTYVKDGITKWIFNWKKNGWKASNKKPVKNVELWKELDKIVQEYDIEWKWVKGHSGNEFNEVADKLAVGAVKK